MQYCSLQHQTLLLSPVTSTTGCCFLLCLCLFILSKVISPLISSSILGTYKPGEFIFQCPIFLPFHTVHGFLKARILTWFAIPFSSGPHSARPLHYVLSILGGPPMAWPGFFELGKAVVHVIRLASFLWLWFQSVLWCPLSFYCLTWVSLILDMGYLFTTAPAKRSHCSLPWTCDMSSGPPLLTLNMGYLLSVTGHSCAAQLPLAAPVPAATTRHSAAVPSLSAYCLTWVSLTLCVGYLFMAAPAKCSRCSLPWTWSISSLPLALPAPCSHFSHMYTILT